MSDSTDRRSLLGTLGGAAAAASLSREGRAAVKLSDPEPPPDPAFSVRSFGVVGDGRNDDTAALQAALDAMQRAGHRSFYLPPGQYCISRPLKVPLGLSSAEFRGASGYDGVRGPINFGLSTSLKWIGPEALSSPVVRFDQSSGIRWAGISIDCSYKAGFGLQFMSGDGSTGSVKNIVENCSIHYAARDGIIVGEWGTPSAGPGKRQFFGNVFRNLTFFGCCTAAIHVNEWNADQQLFDTVMVYFDDGTPPRKCENAFWFDHGGQWSMLINCQAGGLTTDPAVPSSGFMIRNQASDSTTGGAFGLTVINAWQEGAGGLYYGVTSTNDNKGFTFIGCASFTSGSGVPSIFIDKGTSTRIGYTFVGCSLASDIKIATPTARKGDIVLLNCSFSPGKGVLDPSGRRTIDGVYRLASAGNDALVIPSTTETLFCTLTAPVRSVQIAGVAPAGYRITAIITQDEVGHHAVNWNATGAFAPRPAIPQPDPTPGASTSYTFVSNGSAYILVSCIGAG